MKRFLAAVAFGLMAIAAQAEASFDQIEGLIQQKNYAAAEAGLEVIIKNHPNSAKAFYAMAQAQAGLGNLEKAQKALNIATGLNPTLDFAPASSVQSLKDAITPQTAKIEAVEESHALRNFMLFAMFAGFGVACYFLYSVYARKQEEEAAAREAERKAERQAQDIKSKQEWQSMIKKQESERKESAPQAEASIARSGPAVQQPLYTPQPTHTTVVNNSNDGLLTGILIGDMLNHHHDTTRVVEREVIREVEVPAKAPKSSWDDIGTPNTSSSRSSSWDDTPSSSSRSSSWDSDSSSSSSSSWSSSSSDSSSSWSSSDSSSSSSWD